MVRKRSLSVPINNTVAHASPFTVNDMDHFLEFCVIGGLSFLVVGLKHYLVDGQSRSEILKSSLGRRPFSST